MEHTDNSTSVGIMTNSTGCGHIEMLSNIKGIDYCVSIIVGLVVLYMVVWAIHVAIFKFCGGRKMAQTSLFLDKFFQVSEGILIVTLILSAILVTFHYLSLTLLSRMLFVFLSGCFSTIRMLSETYILLLILFCMTKYFNHFYSGNMVLTPNFWKAGMRISCWFVAIKDLVFLVCFIGVRLGGTSHGRDLFFNYAGLSLLTHFLLFLLVILLGQLLTSPRKVEMTSSEKLLISQTVIIGFFKILLLPSLNMLYIAFIAVEITEPSMQMYSIGILSDILLVPIAVRFSDIIFAWSQPGAHYSPDMKMKEVA